MRKLGRMRNFGGEGNVLFEFEIGLKRILGIEIEEDVVAMEFPV